MKKFSVALAAAVLAGAGVIVVDSTFAARAEEAGKVGGPRVPVTAANVEQKAKFITNLITSSASLRAIESSDDVEAKASIQTARNLVAEAMNAMAGGQAADADEKLNRAVDLIMAQTRKVSLGTQKDVRAKQIYESRLGSVKALVDAYERVSKEKGTSNRSERRSAVAAQLAEIEKMAADGNYEGAVVQLDKAYSAVSVDVAALREGDKLRKDLTFASAEEEYIYEIDRNDSHQFLLKLTLTEKPPHEMYAGQIAGLKAEAEDLRKAAESKGKSKDYGDAIRELGDSTQRLIKALRMAGAYIPG